MKMTTTVSTSCCKIALRLAAAVVICDLSPLHAGLFMEEHIKNLGRMLPKDTPGLTATQNLGMRRASAW